MGSRLLCGGRSVSRSALFVLMIGLAACSGDGEGDGDDPPGEPNPAGNIAPVAQFSGGNSAVAGQPVSLDGGGSSDRDGRIVGYHWLFGDGSNGSGASVRHVYARPGSYQITLTVTDDAGARDHASRRIFVASPDGHQGDADSGARYFTLHCNFCHAVGDVFDSHEYEWLVERIETTMPPGNVSACDSDCSADIAAFILTW